MNLNLIFINLKIQNFFFCVAELGIVVCWQHGMADNFLRHNRQKGTAMFVGSRVSSASSSSMDGACQEDDDDDGLGSACFRFWFNRWRKEVFPFIDYFM